MSFQDRIKQHFSDSIQTKISAADSLPDVINISGKMIAESLISGGKVLSCGNGSSVDDSKRFSTYLVNRFEIERPSLPAIALNTDISAVTYTKNGCNIEEIFSRQVYSLGSAGDILLIISTEGNTENIVKAIEVAHEKDIKVIALIGGNGNNIRQSLQDTDVEICVDSSDSARIQECQVLIINCLCDIVDQSLFS